MAAAEPLGRPCSALHEDPESQQSLGSLATVPTGAADAAAAAERREYCCTALQEKKQDTGAAQYLELVGSIAGCTEPGVLREWLGALTYCVSDITDDLEELLTVVLGLAWHKDSALAADFVNFLCHLVSANGCFVEPCLRVLVQHMLPPEEEEQAAVGISDIVHSALAQLLRIFPASSVCLAAVLRENFPHKRMSANTHVVFLRHLLFILNNSPDLYGPLLACIVEKCIELDVDIKLDDFDEQVERVTSRNDEGLFQMDEAGDEEELSARVVDGEQDTVAAAEDESVAHKLDLMMDLLFNFIRQQCRGSLEAQDSHQSDHLFRAMMRIFNSVIVTTHQSKFVQFLIFFICGLDPDFAESFIQATSDATTSPATPMNLRLLCCSYLSSFVGRASFVTMELVRETLTNLMAWLHKYMDEHGNDDGVADSMNRPHELFYSVSQSIFYMICFRHKALLESADGVSWLRSLDLRRLITARLNPLGVCSDDIVAIFVQIMDTTKVLDCSVTMEQNRAMRHRPWAQLEVFFPFDPYQLPVSAHHVEKMGYLQFTGCVGDEENSCEDGGPSSLEDTPTDCSGSLGSSLVGSGQMGSVTMMMFSPPVGHGGLG